MHLNFKNVQKFLHGGHDPGPHIEGPMSPQQAHKKT